MSRASVRGVRAAVAASVAVPVLLAVSVSPSGAAARPTALPADCVPSGAVVEVTTNRLSYPLGPDAVFTSSITNTSGHACTLGVGPRIGISPYVYVLGPTGNLVWNNCRVDDAEGACLLLFSPQTLEPGATFTRSFTWDLGAAIPSGAIRRVADGTYTVVTSYGSVLANPTTPATSAPVPFQVTG